MVFRPTHRHAPANRYFELGPPPRSGPCGKNAEIRRGPHTWEFFKLPPSEGRNTQPPSYFISLYPFVDIAYRALHPHRVSGYLLRTVQYYRSWRYWTGYQINYKYRFGICLIGFNVEI